MTGSSLAFYLRFFRGRWPALLLTSSLLVVQPAVLLSILYAIRTRFSEDLARESIAPLVLVSLGLVLLYLVAGGLALFVRHRIMAITHEAIQGLRRELAMRLYAFSREQYASFDRKRLQTVLVQDVIRVDVMTNALAGQLFPALIIVATLTAFLLVTSLPLLLILSTLIPLLVALEALLRPLLRRLLTGHHRSLETLQKTTLFGLEALDLTHERGASEREIEQQVRAGEKFRRISTRLAFLREFRAFGQELLMLAVSITCLLAGAWLIVSGDMNAADLLVFYMAIVVMRPHVQTCWNALPQIVEGFESLRTLEEWHGTASGPRDAGDLTIRFTGDVVFSHVAFGYDGSPLLTDVNLHIRPGEVVAVCGPNGAGKSTLAYLLLGFYRPERGEILIDGHSLAELAPVPYRRQVGVVPQNPFIFHGSLLDNITYGIEHPDMSEVEAACRRAQLGELVESLPAGYDTLVGDQGMKLSGGQRQRIAVARALLTRPPLLILDEPTNHLDRSAVREMMGRLRDRDYRPGILLITHDNELLDASGSAYLLQDGRLRALDSAGGVTVASHG